MWRWARVDEIVIEGWWSYNTWTLEGLVEEWTLLEMEKARKVIGGYIGSQNRQERYEDLGRPFRVFEPPSELAGCIAVWKAEEMMTEYWVG